MIMSLSEKRRFGAAASVASAPSAFSLSASAGVSFFVAITAPDCVRAHAVGRINAEQMPRALVCAIGCGAVESHARQEWLMDTCRGRRGRNYLPGCVAAMALSARWARRRFNLSH